MARTCPKCNQEMEDGYLRAESFIGGVKWMRERSSKSLGVESIAKPDSLGFVFIRANRCKECKFIEFVYQEQK